MNLRAVHVVVLALGALVAAAQALASSDPKLAPICAAVSTVAASLAATLGVLSPSAAAAPVAK